MHVHLYANGCFVLCIYYILDFHIWNLKMIRMFLFSSEMFPFQLSWKRTVEMDISIVICMRWFDFSLFFLGDRIRQWTSPPVKHLSLKIHLQYMYRYRIDKWLPVFCSLTSYGSSLYPSFNMVWWTDANPCPVCIGIILILPTMLVQIGSIHLVLLSSSFVHTILSIRK